MQQKNHPSGQTEPGDKLTSVSGETQTVKKESTQAVGSFFAILCAMSARRGLPYHCMAFDIYFFADTAAKAIQPPHTPASSRS